MIASAIAKPIARSVFKDGTIWLDRFDDVDGTLISAHKPEIGSAYTGTATIVGNAVVGQIAGNESVAAPDLGLNAYEADLVITSITDRVFLYFRKSDIGNSNFWYIVRNTVLITLYEVNAGVFINRGAATISFTGTENLYLNDDGNNIVVSLNGVSVAEYASSFANQPSPVEAHVRGIGTTIDSLKVRAL